MTLISNGLRSAMSYTGSKSLAEFKDNAKFVQVSTSSLSENGAHGF
jgi:IMP dehydrogenase/GMP reductase